MSRLAANLSMMYTEHPFLDRFEAAARDGFAAVEFLFPYEYPAAELKTRLEAQGLSQALFNAPPGDWAAGERGTASLPGRESEFRHGVEQALEYAAALGNRKLHLMAGLIQPGQDRAAHRAVYQENLAWAARAAAAAGVTVLIEPINTRDIPGFFLNRQDEAQAICAEVGADNLKVQFDIYHCQIVEGDIAVKLKRDMAGIGHIQIAGVPDRHEPDLGELNYPYLFEQIDALGYAGWIGCEYRPRAGTSAGLGWARPYLTHTGHTAT
ncbi:hydroxypyruvate isomerase 2 [Achromobacter xylosoxidans A8]|uniref:Hydroxypyruvate isomerase 2 n=1 Tax=Achromobacter xylosoxidans (strain A8) TaxID=762376 RepID=E3HKK2_ACHXA|nr:2-oxo-tetronate isomerase [Achromobacter xylosoxidans]ADP19290.1 hydroxypyruvate isomerase 2 [Achromobacter xylosoxidans A8]